MRRLQVLPTVLLLITGAAAAQDPAPLSDTEIQRLVEQKLRGENLLPDGVEVSVDGGAVTLNGKVPNVWTKDQIIALALDVPQAKEILSELTIATGESDEDLAKQLAEKIRRYPSYTIHDEVTGRVEEGVVYLVGWVTMPFKRSDIEEMASQILGVQELRNEISVLPTSGNDDQLRETLARRIYSDATFRPYASQAYPPIHIIVFSSRVLLTGVVRSEVERVKAERIVSSTPGVLSVENLLRLDR